MPDAEILLYSPIGGFDGVTAAAFASALAGSPADAGLTVRLNSPGGDVFDGLTIYNLLLAERRKGRKVVAIVDGLAASAASLVAMGADEIHMASESMMMIHNPWGLVVGGAEDMRAEAEVLDQLQGLLVAAYAKKTRKRPETLKALMNAETWMTAADAVAEGFADKAIPAPRRAQARFDLSRFSAVPPSAIERFAPIADSLAPPTRHDPQEEHVMKNEQISPAALPDAVATELAELRALRAAAVAATGCETGLVGALGALKVNADRAAALDETIQVRAVVDSMVSAGQIGPAERAHYEGHRLMDVQAAARVLRRNPPPQTAPQSGAIGEKPAAERVDSSDRTAAQAKARKLLGKE